jgi:hypothetical protein
MFSSVSHCGSRKSLGISLQAEKNIMADTNAGKNLVSN